MDDFAASEKDGSFNFVALFQESNDVVLFEFVIVLIRIGSKLHFFNSDVLLVLLRFVKLLVHLIEVLSVIHDPTDRGIGGGRYLYQVQAALFSDLQCLLRRQDSELLVLIIYDSNLASSNSLVHPNVFIDGLDLPKYSS